METFFKSPKGRKGVCARTYTGYVHAHTRGFQHLNPYIGCMYASFTRHPCPAVDGYPQHATGPLLYRNRKRSSNSKMYYRVLELLADAQYTQRERWSHSGRSFGVQAGVIVRVLLCVWFVWVSWMCNTCIKVMNYAVSLCRFQMTNSFSPHPPPTTYE